jgi:hypothetical protein
MDLMAVFPADARSCDLQLRAGFLNCCNIAITLINAEKGEVKAQACVIT